MSESASRDNADWGLTVERAACEPWNLEHTANDPDAHDWFDARATTVIRGTRTRERAESSEESESDADTAVEGRSTGANPGFEAGESTAHDHTDHEQGRAAVASQHAPDERARTGRSG